MVLQLNTILQQQLEGWAREGYTLECCGLLLGHTGEGGVRVEEVLRSDNANVVSVLGDTGERSTSTGMWRRTA